MSQPTILCAAEWVDSQKKGSRVLVDPQGFQMKFKVESGGKKFFECLKRKELKCNVFITLDVEEDMIVDIRGEHCHDNNLLKEKVKEVVNSNVETLANQPYVAPRAVFQNITQKILGNKNTSSGLVYAPTQNCLAKRLQRKRKSSFDSPPLPTSWEEISVPDHFKSTTDGQDFLILEEELNDRKILGFASPSMLQVLRSSDEWFIDGFGISASLPCLSKLG